MFPKLLAKEGLGRGGIPLLQCPGGGLLALQSGDHLKAQGLDVCFEGCERSIAGCGRSGQEGIDGVKVVQESEDLGEAFVLDLVRQ